MSLPAVGSEAPDVTLPSTSGADSSLAAFRGRQHVKRTVSRANGTLIEAKHHTSRASILIDRSGMVRWTWEETTSGRRRDHSELLAQLAALR